MDSGALRDGDSHRRIPVRRRVPVDHIRVEIGPRRPGDAVADLIHRDTLEHRPLAQGAEHRTVEQRLDVHVAYLAVGENDPDLEGSSGIAAFTPGPSRHVDDIAGRDRDMRLLPRVERSLRAWFSGGRWATGVEPQPLGPQQELASRVRDPESNAALPRGRGAAQRARQRGRGGGRVQQRESDPGLSGVKPGPQRARALR
jgi:hypothetical protein